MAKWSGNIGFIEEIEDEYGVVTTSPIDRPYIGDWVRNYRRVESGISVNNKVSLSNSLSVVADPYIADNLQNIRYVEYINSKWKVESVEIQYPRIILTLGGEYTNG